MKFDVSVTVDTREGLMVANWIHDIRSHPAVPWGSVSGQFMSAPALWAHGDTNFQINDH